MGYGFPFSSFPLPSSSSLAKKEEENAFGARKKVLRSFFVRGPEFRRRGVWQIWYTTTQFSIFKNSYSCFFLGKKRKDNSASWWMCSFLHNWRGGSWSESEMRTTRGKKGGERIWIEKKKRESLCWRKGKKSILFGISRQVQKIFIFWERKQNPSHAFSKECVVPGKKGKSGRKRLGLFRSSVPAFCWLAGLWKKGEKERREAEKKRNKICIVFQTPKRGDKKGRKGYTTTHFCRYQPSIFWEKYILHWVFAYYQMSYRYIYCVETDRHAVLSFFTMRNY